MESETRDRGRYRLRLIDDLHNRPGQFHPSVVTAIADGFGDGWIPAFVGATSPNGYHRPGHGDLAGCVTYTRRGPDTGKTPPKLIRTNTSVLNAVLAHPIALGGTLAEEAELADATRRARQLHALLGDWLDLGADERSSLEDSRWPIEQFLSGSIDWSKRQAHAKIVAMDAMTDSTGRPNPQALRARLLAVDRLMIERQQKVTASRIGIIDRWEWTERMLLRLQLDTIALWRFFADRQTLLKSDVEEFNQLTLDTLNPLCQLVGYLCWELAAGDGDIRNPVVIETALRALTFHRSYSYLLDGSVRILAAMSVVGLQRDHTRYCADYLEELKQRARFLRRLDGKIGGPYDHLVHWLWRRMLRVISALERGDWAAAIGNAKTFRYGLIHRAWPADQTHFWYGQTPSGSDPVLLVDRWNGIEPRPPLTPEQEDDLFDQLGAPPASITRRP